MNAPISIDIRGSQLLARILGPVRSKMRRITSLTSKALSGNAQVFSAPARKSGEMRSQPGFAPAPRPIFIIGAPRSGTSITTWALGQHPNIQPMPETAWIAVMAIAAQQAYNIDSERGRYSHLSNVSLPPEPFLRRIGEAVDKVVNDVFDERCTRLHGDWRALGKIRNAPDHPNPEMLLRRHSHDPKKRWIDGTPLNTKFAWGLATMFPEGRFLHLVRQPHEVVASLRNFDAVGGIRHDIDGAIRNWIDHTRQAFLAQRAFGSERVHVARFEELSADPRAFFGGILGFLGEDWSEDCLAPLGRKINSSNVEDEREKVREAVRDNRLYRKAKDLYRQVFEWTGEEIDEAALDELRANTLRNATERRLIG